MRFLASLTNRIFLAGALLAALSLGGAVYFVNGRVIEEAEAELQRDLTEAAELLTEQRRTLFDSFRRTAQLIADLPRFKAVVELADVPTLAPVAREYLEQAGADVLIVTNANGDVLVAAGIESVEAPAASLATGVARARRGEAAVDVWPLGRGLLQVATVPVLVGSDLLGTLTLGYLLSEARAAEFRATTGTDLAITAGGRVLLSTIGRPDAEALSGLAAGTPPPRVVFDDVEFETRVVPLPAPGAAEAGAGIPRAIMLRSRTERMRTVSDIRAALGVLAFLTMVVAVGASYAVARTITRPLGAITDHMRQMAATGDLTTRLALGESGVWVDEDARLLAATFNSLTESVGRFQQEAAQRERLSALGRLSTVIAHEIRNPLMIIKGALRTLTRDGASSEDVRDAANDIDEETERLNRIVNEVLDFARPIRLERAPADLNAVARDAAVAVTQAESGPPVAVVLDPSCPVVESDAERVRTVLVNLLANARQAVQARERRGEPVRIGAHGTDAPVAIVTERIGDRRAAIVVADRGVGIAADDLRRVFDPYFTTRRGGTGLGLPIAKNIVDALGGTIAVASRPGDGTDIRIELGDAPATRS
ncbi:MAG: ATP-binding protein [Acidobacteriota bacterium]